MQSIFCFYFDIEIWFSWNLNFIFRLQLQKDTDAQNKLYENSWEIAQEMHYHA